MFPNENAYDDIIAAAAQDNSVPAALVKGIIAQESGFSPTAYRYEASVNDASYGLMQLLLQTARQMGFTGDPTGLYDPATNINLGTRFLAYLVQQSNINGYGVESAVSAYNGGFSADRPGDGKRNTTRQDGYLLDGSALAPFINQSYVNAVMGYANKFAAGQPSSPALPPGALTDSQKLALGLGAGAVLLYLVAR